MPIRNPFRKNAAGVEPAVAPQDPAAGFRETTTSAAQPIDVKDPAEYKLSGELAGCLTNLGWRNGLTLWQKSTTVVYTYL